MCVPNHSIGQANWRLENGVKDLPIKVVDKVELNERLQKKVQWINSD